MISVIVPVYNAEKYLKECIESILNQSVLDLELILVNDGSKDCSLQICQSYNDSRIIVIDKENGGVSSARNKGIEIAKGEYIAFVDSDDTLPPDSLLLLYEAILEKNAKYAIGSFQYQYGEFFYKHTPRLSEGLYNFKDLLPIFFDDGTLSGFLIGSMCGGLYRKDVIIQKGIRLVEGLKNNEDGLFNFEFALSAEKLSVISQVVYNYRQEISSTISLRKSENFGEKIFHYIDNLEWDREANEYETQKCRRIATLAWWKILHNYRDYSFCKSIAFIKESISDKNMQRGLRYMQFTKMSIYKRFFYLLMRYKLSLLMYISLRFVVPMLKHRGR